MESSPDISIENMMIAANCNTVVNSIASNKEA